MKDTFERIMDSLNSSHLVTETNGQNRDVFDHLFGFERYDKELHGFETAANGVQNGTNPNKCSIISDERIMHPISIDLSLPSFHSNGNGLTDQTVFQISDNGDVGLPSAQVPPQIIYSTSNFTDFGNNETSDSILSNNTQPDAQDSVATAKDSLPVLKSTTPKVSKTKPRSKLRTINYSNQKLILPNKEHIPLQSLLSAAEKSAESVSIMPAKVVIPGAKRKATKNASRSAKSETVTKKRIIPADPTPLIDAEQYSPCFVYSERNHPDSPVILSNRPSGVFPITSTAPIEDSFGRNDGILDSPTLNDYPNLTLAKEGDSNGLLATSATLNPEHYVAMDFNFAEYALPGPSRDVSVSPHLEVQVKEESHVEAINTEESSLFKMDGDRLIYEDLNAHIKLIYSVLSPQYFDLSESIETPSAVKRVAEVPRDARIQQISSLNDEKSKAKRRRGRPRRSKGKTEVKPEDQKSKEGEEKKVPCSRTRYGRLSRPPRSMKIFADVDGGVLIKPNDLNEEETKPNINIHLNASNDIQMENTPIPGISEIFVASTPTAQPEVKRQRNIERFKCLTCKKVYLGNKMFKHLKAFPDHKQNTPENCQTTLNGFENFPVEILSTTDELPAENLSIFDELMKRIHNVPKEKRTHLFLTEVSDFVERLEMLGPKLMANENINAPIEYLDKHVCKLFGIQEGNYQINENVFEKNAKLRLSDGSYGDPNDLHNHSDEYERHNMPNPEPISTSSQPLEYNLNMLSLDGISNSKMNLSGSISEESLLHELVKERSKNLPDDTLRSLDRPVSYDHISDNAVEAVAMKVNTEHDLHIATDPPILDLSLDMFQFNSN